MVIKMFNGWYFFWIAVSVFGVVGLYFSLRNKAPIVQKTVLFSLLAFGFLCHFLKAYIPPYSVDKDRMLRDAWFVNICGANIGLFPFLFFSKNKHVKDYMFYIGVLSGLIALFYPQEPMAKIDQVGEFWDIVRFYYHHWMVMAVPLLMVLFKQHTLSYRRIVAAPIGLLLVMLFIMLNQIFQSELGFIPLRDGGMYEVNYKNTSYIWGPELPDPIGAFLAKFCPTCFKTIPVGAYAGQEKYWPWFWLIFPVFILVTPLSFCLAMVCDYKRFVADFRAIREQMRIYREEKVDNMEGDLAPRLKNK